jgi:uncharacterized protein (TIGR00730 family)
VPGIDSICVYCGSQPGQNGLYLQAAQILGRSMGQSGIELIYGGGATGIMGALAQSTLDAGGRVTGIIPQFLVTKEAAHESLEKLTDYVITENMHERKHAMFERADAFVALPGGIGTLEEIIEIMTWAQLGRHAKPIALANIDGFWDPLLCLLDHMREAGFIHTIERVRPLVIHDPSEIVRHIVDAGSSIPHAAEGNRETIARM